MRDKWSHSLVVWSHALTFDNIFVSFSRQSDTETATSPPQNDWYERNRYDQGIQKIKGTTTKCAFVKNQSVRDDLEKKKQYNAVKKIVTTSAHVSEANANGEIRRDWELVPSRLRERNSNWKDDLTSRRLKKESVSRLTFVFSIGAG